MELYLIRHPRPAVPPSVCYGCSDIGLAEDVTAAAQRLCALLPASYALYASPLTRCRLLADALGAAPVFDARLMEMDFGTWEMQTFDAIGRAALDEWSSDFLGYRPAGGESARDMEQRVLACFEELLAGRHEHAVIVGHSGPMRAIAAHLLQLPPQRWLALDFAYGTATRFDIKRDWVRLVWLNR